MKLRLPINEVIGLHTFLYRATGGIVGRHLPGVPAMLLLDHKGARERQAEDNAARVHGRRRRHRPRGVEGRPSETPRLVPQPQGQPGNQGPSRNEEAGRQGSGRDRGERRRLWPEVVDLYGGYANYQDRTEREIPLVILEPR